VENVICYTIYAYMYKYAQNNKTNLKNFFFLNIFFFFFFKVADIFGCRTLMIFILIIFTAASFLCGIAPNIGVLIVGRALQGIGSGGIAALAFIIIADITSLRKRGIYMGVNGAIYAVTSVIGPLLGGFFTDQLTWRWSFFINLPIGIICIIFFVLYFKIPTEKSSFIEKFKRIDFLGTFTLIACLVVALLGLNWGGKLIALDYLHESNIYIYI